MRLLIILGLVVLLVGCGSATNPASVSIPRPATPIAVAPTPAAPSECPNAPGPISGSIVFGRDGNLLALQPDGSGLTPLTTLNETRAALDPAWSPDGKTLAFTFTRPSKDPDLAWLPVSMVCALDRATGQGRTLAQAAALNDSFTEPAWIGDGQALIVTSHQPLLNELKQYGGDLLRLARYDLATQAVTPLMKNGKNPSVAPDGSRMVYIDANPDTFISTLMVANLDGSNPQPLDRAKTNFLSISNPIWSPDGSQIVFAAAPGVTSQSRVPDLQWVVDQLLGVEVAEAHGTPADLWLVNADGTNMRALTTLQLDDPRPTWSPTSEVVAYTAGQNLGVYIVPVGGGPERQISPEGNYGGISWRR